MIRPDSYPQSEGPSADHQFGSYKDETAVGANDGTGLFKDELMDLFQPWANLFTKHSITPSNVKEKQSVSQVTEALDAELTLTAGNVDTMNANGTYTVEFDNKNGILILETPLTTVTLAGGSGINDGSRITVLNNTGGTITLNPGSITLLDTERMLLFYNSDFGNFDSLLGKNVISGTIRNLNTVDSTSKDSGSNILIGGQGVGKNQHVGGTIKSDSANDATTKDAGAIIAVNGGIGAEKSIVAGLGITAADAIAAKIALRSDGKIATGGETAPDVDPGGICLNQGANDNKILTFKSSDVDHGMTDFAEIDTFATFEKINANSGGLELTGYSDGGLAALILNAYSEFGPAFGSVIINAGVQNGTTVDPISDGEIILAIENDDSARILVYGTGRMDVSTGGILTKYSSANTGDPPTDAQCDTAFGTPAAVEAGFMGLLKDTDGVLFLCCSTGADWFTFKGVLAGV